MTVYLQYPISSHLLYLLAHCWSCWPAFYPESYHLTPFPCCFFSALFHSLMTLNPCLAPSFFLTILNWMNLPAANTLQDSSLITMVPRKLCLTVFNKCHIYCSISLCTWLPCACVCFCHWSCFKAPCPTLNFLFILSKAYLLLIPHTPNALGWADKNEQRK